jgi:predicted nucleic acid-binding protein
MLFLFDTNAVSDYMRGEPRIAAQLAALPPSDQAIICSIVRGEILWGIGRLPPGRRRSDLEQAAAIALPALQCFAVPESAGDQYSRIKLASQSAGFTLDENDMWIAATTLALGATIVTRDKDFSRIVGLTIQDWTA